MLKPVVGSVHCCRSVILFLFLLAFRLVLRLQNADAGDFRMLLNSLLGAAA